MSEMVKTKCFIELICALISCMCFAGISTGDAAKLDPVIITNFQGIKFGVPEKKIYGKNVKDSKTVMKEVKFSSPFLRFTKGIVKFDANGMSNVLTTEYGFPASKSQQDVDVEFDKVVTQLKEKYGIVLTAVNMNISYGNRASGNRLTSMGLSAVGSNNSRVFEYRDKSTRVTLSRKKYTIPRKGLMGPSSYPGEGFKLVLCIRSQGYLLAAQREEETLVYARLNSLFGIGLGSAVDSCNGEKYRFTPKQNFLNFKKYYCIVSQKGHIVNSIFAEKSAVESVREDMDTIVRAIEQKFECKMERKNKSCYSFCARDRKSNWRRIQVKYDSSECKLEISLVDSRLKDDAAKEAQDIKNEKINNCVDSL